MESVLKEFVAKLTRYDWFTVFVPGLFAVVAFEKLGIGEFLSVGLLKALIYIFMVGIVSSRIGASIVEPIARIKRFGLSYKYEDYLEFRNKDSKGAEMLIGNSNFYRGMVGAFLLVLFTLLLSYLKHRLGLSSKAYATIVLSALLFLFADSYRRQLVFINKRINKSKNATTEGVRQ